MADPDRVMQCALLERLMRRHGHIMPFLISVSMTPKRRHYLVTTYHDVDDQDPLYDPELVVPPKQELPKSLALAAKRFGLE